MHGTPLRTAPINRTRIWVAFLALSLGLSACRPALSAPQTEPDSRGMPTSTTRQPPASAEASECNLSAGWTVEYSVSGGLAGGTETMRLRDTGEASFSSSSSSLQSTGSVLPHDMDELKAALETACAAGQTSGRGKPCPDCLKYRIVLSSLGKSIEWSRVTGDELPPSLDNLYGIVDRLAQDLGRP